MLDETSFEVTHHCNNARMFSSTRMCIDNSPGDGVLGRGKRHSQGPVGKGLEPFPQANAAKDEQ